MDSNHQVRTPKAWSRPLGQPARADFLRKTWALSQLSPTPLPVPSSLLLQAQLQPSQCPAETHSLPGKAVSERGQWRPCAHHLCPDKLHQSQGGLH